MSSLKEHAEYELKLLNWTDDKEIYKGLLSKAVLELIDVFSKQGHSEASATVVREVFNKLAQVEPLSELTNNPKEWFEYEDGMFQSKRSPSCFSLDLKYYYNLDDKRLNQNKIKTIPNNKGYKLIKLKEYKVING